MWKHRTLCCEFTVVTMDASLLGALETLATAGDRLRTTWRFDWPAWARQAIERIQLSAIGESAGQAGKSTGVGGESTGATGGSACSGGKVPPLVAIVGGASSGKSTIFNNLLDGHVASRVTARGHMTRGPILAVHEQQREWVETCFAAEHLLPDLQRTHVELDGATVGQPDGLATLYHTVDALRGVLLFDMPDFTSQAAAQEGDVTMALLPWFDRLVVVVDHERWFDRQSISNLRIESARFAQRRWVLFNRTHEGDLAELDAATLTRQAERLDVAGQTIIEFRRGRGLCLLPPRCLDDVKAFLRDGHGDRTATLLRELATLADRTLGLNEERAVRMSALERSAATAIDRATPTVDECMTSLMTAVEREQLEVLSRVLRLREGKAWLREQSRRLQGMWRRVPLVGAMNATPNGNATGAGSESSDRRVVGRSYFQATATRQVHELQRSVRSSAFWDEVRQWTKMEPTDRAFEWSPALEQSVATAIDSFDHALTRWNEKVESECKGIAPNVTGAVGLGAVALAVALVLVPGPVTVLTLISAKGAIAAAITKIGASAGLGALFGRQMGRFLTVMQEKLIGCAELNAVRTAAAGFRQLLVSHGGEQAARAVAEAQALVIRSDDPVAGALETLRECPGDSA